MTSRETARLEARVPVHVYAAVKRAAELKGGTITDFVVDAVHAAARRTIEDAEIVRLSAEDQLAFVRSLIEPPAPNEALIKAARVHRDNVEVR